MSSIATSRALVEEAFANADKWKSNMAAAEALLSKALKASPEDITVLTCLGAVLCDHAKHRKAADLLEQAVKLGSTDRNTHYNLGVALVACASRKKATTAFERAQNFSASRESWTAYFDPHAQ